MAGSGSPLWVRITLLACVLLAAGLALALGIYAIVHGRALRARWRSLRARDAALAAGVRRYLAAIGDATARLPAVASGIARAATSRAAGGGAAAAPGSLGKAPSWPACWLPSTAEPAQARFTDWPEWDAGAGAGGASGASGSRPPGPALRPAAALHHHEGGV
jgi:hypothetical protein